MAEYPDTVWIHPGQGSQEFGAGDLIVYLNRTELTVDRVGWGVTTESAR